MLSRLLSTLLLTRAVLVLGDPILEISTPQDFIKFSNNVNSGTSYEGTTAFLAGDIDMSGIPFEPIGNSSDHYFEGTFDGQGHVISNLVINSSLQHVGLFGYSGNLTIKNVVIDDSCSITSSYNISDYYGASVGSFLGWCQVYDLCVIENTVNMASVTFNGNLSGYYEYLYLGGISGGLYLRSYRSATNAITVKNCVNYGSVTQSGHSKYAFIGGIVGYTNNIVDGPKEYIQNCLNYGTIIYNGKTTEVFYIGGIIGLSKWVVIDSCVSYGNITSSEKSEYIGSIIGYINYESILKHCYWNEDISYNAYGYKEPSSTVSNIAKFNSNFELNETITTGKYRGISLIETLNVYSDYYSLYDYSHWLLNKNEKAVSFTVNKVKLSSTVNSKLILLPNFASDGRLCFDGWYTNSACTTPLVNFEINTNMDLYGKWEENCNNYTITFNTQGGTPIDPISAQYLTSVTFPNNLKRNNCTFSYWRNEYRDKVESPFMMPARNVTLTAMWECTHIVNADDLVVLADCTNSRAVYSGTTIFLDNDIDMNGIPFKPIGMDYFYCLQGIFEGQGHTISNLVINSPLQYAGLFGYSRGLTIKNVVIDSSCSITSSYSKSNSDVFMGGIVGYCPASNTPCVIENSVNMASVTFTGVIDSNLYLGGIIGRLYYFDISTVVTTIKNCANYGSVTHSGTSEDSYIGGVVGHSYGHASKYTLYVQNCLNYGTISYNCKTSTDLSIGGIVGYSEHTDVENCVSSGIIIKSSTTTSANNYIKSVVGNTSSDTNITHCFWTSDVGYDQYELEKLNVDNEAIDASLVTIDSELMNRLNDYSKTKLWSSWAMLNLKGGSINNISQKYLTVNNKYFPDPEKKGYIFKGWHKDSKHGEKYDPKEVADVVNVYATYEKNKGSFSVKVTPLLSFIISLFFF